jgi:hypothetical protein
MSDPLVPFSKDCHTSDPHTHVPFAGLQSCAPIIADSQMSAKRPRSKFQIWQRSRELAGQFMPTLLGHAKSAPPFYQEAMVSMGGLDEVDWTNDDRLKELKTAIKDLKGTNNDSKKRRILDQVPSSSSNALVIPTAPQVPSSSSNALVIPAASQVLKCPLHPPMRWSFPLLLKCPLHPQMR